MTEILETFAEVRRRTKGVVGLVPTMGFLHEGHRALLNRARSECDTLVMSLYVNPTQFDESRDLAAYPRDVDRDRAIAADEGVDYVFAPSDAEMYPTPGATTVTLPTLVTRMEGEHRPGHFDGVATVVTKLFAGLQPDLAFFGRKDAQQLAIVRRLASDLSMPVTIVPVPTVREGDGLALSSRNVRIPTELRPAALGLSRGLMAAADLLDAGERNAGDLAAVAWGTMVGTAGCDPQYAAWARQSDLTEPVEIDEPAFLAVAARVGPVRLIDNIHVDFDLGVVTVDRGTPIATTSMLYTEE